MVISMNVQYPQTPPVVKQNGMSEIQTVMLPQKQSFRAPTTVAGLICRFIIILAGAYGTCLMLDDAFSIYSVFHEQSLGYMMVFNRCLWLCGAFFICEILKNINKLAYIIVSSLTGTFLLVWALLQGVLNILLYAPLTFWNYILTFLVKNGGYSQLSYFRVWLQVCNPDAPGNDFYTQTAFIMFIALVCFIYACCLSRKVRVLPVIIITGFVMTVCFTYNLINENYAFLFTVASAAGILVLKCFDSFFTGKCRRKKKKNPESAPKNIQKSDDRTDEERFMDAYGISYKKKKKKKARAEDAKSEKAEKPAKEKPTAAQLRERLRFYAVGGISGFLVFVIAGGVMAYPAAVTSEPWDDIPILDAFMDSARDFVYDYISGDAAADRADANFAYSGPRSTEPVERHLTYKILIQIDSNSNKTEYLRGWVGELYSDGQWMIDTESSYNKATAGLLPEDVAELFYDIIDYQANHLSSPEYEDTNSRGKGFCSTLVNIKNTAIKSDMFYLPSRFSVSYGLLKFDSADYEEYDDIEWRNHFSTGMLVTGTNKTTKKAEYSAVAHLPFYDVPGYAATTENDISVFELVLRLLLSDSLKNPEQLIADCEKAAEDEGIELSPNCIIYRLGNMSNTEISELEARISSYLSYEQYVSSNYVSVPTEEVAYLYRDALTASGRTEGFSGEEGYEEIYEAIVNTVRWLADNTSYSIKPTGYVDDGSSYIYQFLHTAKNGYCIQYATSAALLLRSLGLPTRYVEGFSVSEFIASEDSTLRYTGYARDKDTHAWVEVYIYGYGWITVEATKPYIGSLFGDETPSTPGTTPTETSAPTPVTSNTTKETEPIQTGAPSETDEATTGGGSGSGTISEETLRAILITAASVLLAATLLYLIMRTAKRRANSALDVLHKTANGENDALEPEEFITKYQTYIFRVLRLCGLTRMPNELLTAFAVRADAVIDSSGESLKAAAAIQKNAYGHAAGISDCADVARYALTLRLHAAEKLPWYKRLLYRDILKTVP